MMVDAFTRKDFLLKDLVVSIGGGRRGDTWLPTDDGQLPPTPISPIASVVANLALIEAVRGTIVDAVKAQQFDDVARAFVAGDTGGSPAIRTAIHEIGAAVVASAAYAALGDALILDSPDPDCCSTSIVTQMTRLSPIINSGLAVHRVTELPRLQHQLAQTIAFVDKAAAARAPHGEEVALVRAQLEGALKDLPQ